MLHQVLENPCVSLCVWLPWCISLSPSTTRSPPKILLCLSLNRGTEDAATNMQSMLSMVFFAGQIVCSLAICAVQELCLPDQPGVICSRWRHSWVQAASVRRSWHGSWLRLRSMQELRFILTKM